MLGYIWSLLLLCSMLCITVQLIYSHTIPQQKKSFIHLSLLAKVSLFFQRFKSIVGQRTCGQAGHWPQQITYYYCSAKWTQYKLGLKPSLYPQISAFVRPHQKEIFWEQIKLTRDPFLHTIIKVQRMKCYRVLSSKRASLSPTSKTQGSLRKRVKKPLKVRDGG